MSVAAVALGTYVLMLAVASGGRALSLKARTGTTGFRGTSGRVGSASWWAGVSFVASMRDLFAGRPWIPQAATA